jgi:TolB-like protein
MIFSTNFSNKTLVILAAAHIFLLSCTTANGPAKGAANKSFANTNKRPIAVLPLCNFSGTKAPLKDIRESLINNLKKAGFSILDDTVLEKFIMDHRIRYTGGIDTANAEALGKETGAGSVLITFLELYSEAVPPKISLTSRLVSADRATSILWMKGVGLAGDDAPGILGIGLIENPKVLFKKAVHRVTASLSAYLSGQKQETDTTKIQRKFWPKFAYRSQVIDPELKYRVAVLPFYQLSERKYAGQLISFHFVRQFLSYGNFDVIEPGVIRQALLGLRVIMHDGLSLANADVVFSRLNADLILTGKVIEYQDYEGAYGKPKVEFSALLIERKSREVVWSSKSYNEGDDGVYFFDMGRVNTAYVMASEMAQDVVDMITEEKP